MGIRKRKQPPKLLSADQLEVVIAKYGLDLNEPFATWKERMQGVAAGVFKPRHAWAIAMACAAIADEAMLADEPRRKAQAKAEGKIEFAPYWSDVMPDFLEWLGSKRGYMQSGGRTQILHCGEVADYWLANRPSE